MSLHLMMVPGKEKNMRTGEVRCGFLTFLFQYSLFQPIQLVQFAKRFANFSTFLNQNDTKSKGALFRVQRRIQDSVKQLIRNLWRKQIMPFSDSLSFKKILPFCYVRLSNIQKMICKSVSAVVCLSFIPVRRRV